MKNNPFCGVAGAKISISPPKKVCYTPLCNTKKEANYETPYRIILSFIAADLPGGMRLLDAVGCVGGHHHDHHNHKKQL